MTPPPIPVFMDEEENGGCLPDNVGTQDMTVLSNLSVEGINENLRARYQRDLVYVSKIIFLQLLLLWKRIN